MNSNRITALIVGILFIIGTTTAVISLLSFAPLIEEDPEDPNYFDNIADKENQMVIAGLFGIMLIVTILAMATVMYPILKKDSETIAVGYVTARTLEAVILTIGLICQLSILALSQEYVRVNTPDVSTYQILATNLLEMYKWTDMLGPVIIFGITAMILNYSYYRSKIVPGFISIWGFIGGVLIIASGIISMFGDRSLNFVWAAPIAINEMVMAIWLIVKGFNLSEIDLEDKK